MPNRRQLPSPMDHLTNPGLGSLPSMYHPGNLYAQTRFNGFLPYTPAPMADPSAAMMFSAATMVSFLFHASFCAVFTLKKAAALTPLSTFLPSSTPRKRPKLGGLSSSTRPPPLPATTRRWRPTDTREYFFWLRASGFELCAGLIWSFGGASDLGAERAAIYSPQQAARGLGGSESLHFSFNFQ